jgi:hypothetical protein
MLLLPRPGGLPARFVLLLEGELPSRRPGTWCNAPYGCFLVPCWEAAMEASVLLTVLLTLLCWLLPESDGWAPAAAPESMARAEGRAPAAAVENTICCCSLRGLVRCAAVVTQRKGDQ